MKSLNTLKLIMLFFIIGVTLCLKKTGCKLILNINSKEITI